MAERQRRLRPVPGQRVGDDIEIYADEARSEPSMSLAQPAPATGAAGGQAALLPERFRRRRGTPDWIGAFAVGAGFGIEEKLAESPPRTTITMRSC
jgi:5-methyltetrahydrofolate--homocysteine methyltransferase